MTDLRKFFASGAVILAASACATPQPSDSVAKFPPLEFSEWKQDDARYRFFPGDKLAINFLTAPELDVELTVAPDGRITLPLMGPVVVANLSVGELQDILRKVYESELVDPSLTVTATEFASQQIFVGGEVRQPGVYPLPGQIDPLQAILMAGGATEASKQQQVIIMRRAPGGQVMTRVVDAHNALRNPQELAIGPLQRFDVVFVSRKRIANENLFIQQFILNALPIDFTFYYDLQDNRF